MDKVYYVLTAGVAVERHDDLLCALDAFHAAKTHMPEAPVVLKSSLGTVILDSERRQEMC